MLPRHTLGRSLRQLASTPAVRNPALSRQLLRGISNSSTSRSSIRQSPDSDSVNFPGAVRSKFTSRFGFQSSEDTPALPTYRVLNPEGQFVNHDYDIDSLGMNQEFAVKLYQAMVKTNIMDKIMYDSQRQGRISFYMVSQGEEAIAVGSAAAMEDGDKVFAQYREQGSLMYRGYTLDEFMNQLFSNVNDYGKGRAMPVHYQSEKLGLFPVSSTLATQLPNAVGCAYGMKMDNLPNVVIGYFGEGAASEGDFHAALNMAATRSCPVLFICRNNGYAISTPTLEQYKGDGIASRGVGYGVDTIRVDGNDILAVLEVTQKARDMAIKEHKPVLIEAMSYRVSHHSTSDDSFAYRARKDVEEWQRRDNPISRFRKFMEARGWWNDDKENQFRVSARKEVLKAFDKAEKAKKPAVRELFADVMKNPCTDLAEQREELRQIVETYPDEYNLDDFDQGVKGL
ncbi:hypothetical protein EX30DRAFT_397794 [Ascodesmis nigricans]|uniref:2-oxoisovalerate dehydrogenase subunit alpha n=1 Tax=Ascodesmis nigricans TaxID=341454 RepID=A0A4S2MN58_9PEZI|nr:hypothetical protein EX30DRAFT_397794 [Ascodesmis nigricans]